jgi:membrane-associated phospholipid phosphatase
MNYFMTASPDFAALLRRSLAAMLAGGSAVVICYFFVDRPVACFVHRHQLDRFEEFRWLTEPPPAVQLWAPLALAALAVRRALGPWRRWQYVLLLACVALIVADQARQSLGDVCGRYWPETWHNDNPSLIGSGAYGFHPFQTGDDVGSFPSGHAARIAAFAAVFWIAYPQARWFCAVLAAPMLAALIAANYHFVGDVIAGTVLGAIVGAYAVAIGGCAGSPPETTPQVGKAS